MTPCVPVPRPSYSQARENLVRAIPPPVICLLGCGGHDCQYEGPTSWSSSQQAIQGLFSSWVTDDIVAMARPSTYLIERYKIIEQFRRLNIRTIINMQLPGEHAHCGPPLEADSGFTYLPHTFMENEIYFYNFGMPDFGVSSLTGMLDAVKVLSFSVQEGRVAVHCHAGLGRTGVLIACYLVYLLCVSASEAVHYVRLRRPRSIQTRAQIGLVFDFARLLAPQRLQFPCLGVRHGAPFTLGQYLRRQALLLHGAQARTLAHTPRLLHLLCGQLTALALGSARTAATQPLLRGRAAIWALRRAVRATLGRKRLLAVRRASAEGSGRSWDEPLMFLERKREVLLNKRSYSESDLSKITLNEVPECRSSSPDRNRKLCNGLAGQSNNQSSPAPAPNIQMRGQRNGTLDERPARHLSNPSVYQESATQRPQGCTAKARSLQKFRSNIDLSRQHRESEQAAIAKAIALAMAQQEPPNDRVLQRATGLQEELNGSECGWAAVAMETDPEVLSCLVWTWLEKLKEPVLNAEDVERLTSATPPKNPLHTLRKSQVHTITCLLDCIAQVSFECPLLEEAMLLRLIRALTRRPPEDTDGYAALLTLCQAEVRELRTPRPLHMPRPPCSAGPSDVDHPSSTVNTVGGGAHKATLLS